MEERRFVAYDELIRGDPRNSTGDACATVESLQGQLGTMRTSPRMPSSVTHHLSLAMDLCVAGFFLYDLYAVAIHEVGIACEVSLRERFLDALRLPVHLRRRGSVLTLETRPDLDLLVQYLWDHWTLEGFDRKFRASFSQLVAWAERSSAIPRSDREWWDNAVRMRNDFAHGTVTIVPRNYPVSILRRAIWMLNELFPDSAAQEYDRPMREAADRAAADFDTEMSRLLDGE